MKRLFFLTTLALIVSTLSYCQLSDIGGNLSLGMSSQSGGDKMIIGFKGGLDYRFCISKLKFQTGLELIKNGRSIHFIDYTNNADYIMKDMQTYIGLPIKYYFDNIGKNDRIYFSPGFYFARMISLKSIKDGYYTNANNERINFDTEEEIINIASNINKNDFGFEMNLGYKIPFAKSYFYLEIESMVGFKSTVTTSDEYKNFYLGLNLGYNFKLK